ncbi:MAG TPA: peptidoglycan recognition family protein [Chthonomonadaceae bacterium]|nr:peptidoglycan recognition family protein [Chthonomonadaceae bacterium]
METNGPDFRQKVTSTLRALVRAPKRRYRRRQLFAVGFGVAFTGLTVALSRLLRRPPPPVPAVPAPSGISEAILGDPPGILFHHSDSPGIVGGKPMNAARLDAMHAAQHPDWAIRYEGRVYHIGYHYVILPDGTVETGRPERCQGAHCPHYNDWLGICLIGAFSTIDNPNWHPTKPTKAQIKALLTLCQGLMSKYHIPPENVRRHRDVRETYCPGGRFPYAEILAQLQAYAAKHPETQPNTPRLVAPPPDPSNKI